MGSAARLRRGVTEASAALPSRPRSFGPTRASDSDSDDEAWTCAVAGGAPRPTAMAATAGGDRRRTAAVAASQAQPARRAAAANHESDDSDDDMWKAATATREQGTARTANASPGAASAAMVDPEDSDDDMWAAAAAAAPPGGRSTSVSVPRSAGQPAAAAQSASAPQRRSEQPDTPSLRMQTCKAPPLQPRRTAPVSGAQPPLLTQRRATEAAQPAASVPVQRAPLAHLRSSQQCIALPHTDPEMQCNAADSAAPKTQTKSAAPDPEQQQADAGMRLPDRTATSLPLPLPSDVSPSSPTRTGATGPDALHAAMAHEVSVMREAAAVAAHEVTTQLAAIMRTVQPLSQRLRALEDQVAASAEAPASSITALLETRIAALEAAQAVVNAHASPAPPANALLEERLAVLEAKAAAVQPADRNQTPPLCAKEDCRSACHAVATDTVVASQVAPQTASEALPRQSLSTPLSTAVKQPVNALPTASAEQPASMHPAHDIAPGPCSGAGAVLCQQGVCTCETRVRRSADVDRLTLKHRPEAV